MNKEIVVVFTAKTKEQIILDGGTSSWKLDCNRARIADYVICTRNKNRVLEGGKGDEEHQSAFLIGKIKDVVISPENSERFLIQFSEFAVVNIPKIWNGERNPVQYFNKDDNNIAGINFDNLNWQAMPITNIEKFSGNTTKDTVSNPLTLEQAKAGLALTFNVPTNSIEITIRL